MSTALFREKGSRLEKEELDRYSEKERDEARQREGPLLQMVHPVYSAEANRRVCGEIAAPAPAPAPAAAAAATTVSLVRPSFLVRSLVRWLVGSATNIILSFCCTSRPLREKF